MHQLPGPAVRRRGERRHQRVLAVRRRRGRAGHPGLPRRPTAARPRRPALVKQILRQHGDRPRRARRRAGRRAAQHLQGGRSWPSRYGTSTPDRQHADDVARPAQRGRIPGRRAALAVHGLQHGGQHPDRQPRAAGRSAPTRTCRPAASRSTTPPVRSSPNYQGLPNNYQVFHFRCPRAPTGSPPRSPGRWISPTAIANFCQTGLNSRVRLILIDPTGKFAAHSLPQGPASYGETEVESPAAGTWTGVIFGDAASTGGTNGVVPWRVATEQHVPFGSVSPSQADPGSGPVADGERDARTTRPPPGDYDGAVVLDPDDRRRRRRSRSRCAASSTRIPGGGFSGTLTGGNGRPNGQGQEQYYEFDVRPGVHNIQADVSFANDPSRSGR